MCPGASNGLPDFDYAAEIGIPKRGRRMCWPGGSASGGPCFNRELSNIAGLTAFDCRIFKDILELHLVSCRAVEENQGQNTF